jgi:ligand-binding sensor domain-containing protein/signal transduction histidine kinase
MLCGFTCGVRLALADPPADSQYVRTDYTLDDGLPDNTVEVITQTENGLLWVGTESGLASFDGRTFTQILLRIPGAPPPSDVTSLVEATDGALWVGTDAGVVRIPKADLGDPYLADAEAFRLGAQDSDEVETLMKGRDGTIWAGTNHGLYRFDGKRFLCVLPSVYVSRIHQGLDGRLLLITGNEFMEYAGGRTIEHPGLGARFGVHDDQIFDVFQSADGTMWYGTHQGIRAVQGNTVLTPDPWQPAHTSTDRISRGADGATWVSTGVGLYRVSPEEMSTPAPGLMARAFYAGKDGDIWIGTNGSGLVHLRRRLVQMYTTANGLPFNNIVMAVLPAQDGHLWIGSNCGLSMFDGQRFRSFAEKEGLKNSCVWSLAEDREQNLWIGTYGGGLFRYRNGVFTQYSTEQGLGSRVVFVVRVARDDSVWIATPDGLSHMQDGAIRNYTTADGLSSDRILDVHQDGTGTIWVATQGGVDRLVSRRFVALPATQGAAEVLARRFVESSNGDLYTTDVPHGVSQIRNGQMTLLNGTLDLMEMAETRDRTLWFSGRNGITRIQEEEFGRARDSDRPLNYETFNRADGLNTTQASVGSPNIAAGSDGKLWIATVAGLAMIDTSLLPHTSRRPAVFIAGVSTDGKPSRIGSELALRPGIHHVELRLATISSVDPQKIRLQYMLENVDSGWLDASASRMAVYTAIPAGRHRMLVRETDTLGNWGPPEVIYEVTQRPHFYATTLFQLSTAIAVALLLVLVYVLRVRHMVRQTRVMLEHRQSEREAVARDLHDTFLQGVQALILRFHTGTQQLSEDDPVRGAFEEALSQSDQVILEGRSVLSRLRARQSKSENLTEAYAAIGNELRSLGGARLEVIVDGRSRDLDNVVQEELLKIGREALFNAWRHARASRIEVEVHFGIFEFRIHFRDDGVGIDPAILSEGSVDGHYGLPGMRERTAKVGGRMVLWSRPGAGTEIEIRIPGVIAYRHKQRRARPQWIRRLLKSRAL